MKEVIEHLEMIFKGAAVIGVSMLLVRIAVIIIKTLKNKGR